MKKYIVGVSSLLLPSLTVFAQIGAAGGAGNIETVSQLISRVQSVVNLIIPFIVGLAVLVIIYGIFTFISSAGDEEKRATAKQFIIWGIIGVFIMISVWGLISILVNSFGTTGSFAQQAATTNATVPVVNPGSGY